MQDYAGNVAQIPVGNKGIMSDMAPSAVPYDYLTRVYNCDYNLGYLQKAPGSIQYNTSALPSGVVAILDYWPTV